MIFFSETFMTEIFCAFISAVLCSLLSQNLQLHEQRVEGFFLKISLI
jgi:hypothetical protein